MMRRAQVACLFVACVLAAVPYGPTTAMAGVQRGAVSVTLTLRGDVPTNDAFEVVRDTVPPSIIEPGGFVCGTDPNIEGLEPCTSGATYVVQSPQLVSGTVIAFAVYRNGVRVAGLEGQAIVRAGMTTTVALVFDYGLGSIPDTSTIGQASRSRLPMAQVTARQPTGTVEFTITLTGPVDPTDLFGLFLTKDECCFTDPITMVCGSPKGSPPCASGTYPLHLVGQPVGTEVAYALVRFPRALADGTVSARDRPEYMLRGTVVVRTTTQHISLTYVYPGASGLPDTAIQPPS